MARHHCSSDCAVHNPDTFQDYLDNSDLDIVNANTEINISYEDIKDELLVICEKYVDANNNTELNIEAYGVSIHKGRIVVDVEIKENEQND